MGWKKETWFTELLELPNGIPSHNHAAGKKALHLFIAWAVENRLVLAQVATEEKSNAHYRYCGFIPAMSVNRLYCHDRCPGNANHDCRAE